MMNKKAYKMNSNAYGIRHLPAIELVSKYYVFFNKKRRKLFNCITNSNCEHSDSYLVENDGENP